jgi:DNA polymerase-3 subunit chi
MTDIQFYNTCVPLLESFDYVRRLVARARATNHQILIQVPNPDIGEQLDTLLWDFENTAFLPHTLGVDNFDAVNISWAEDPNEHHDVLINLCEKTPKWFGRFGKLLEIINNDEQVMASKRASYKFFKDRGYPLKYHDFSQH